MTEEERRLLTEDEDVSGLLAFFHFRRALQCAGVPVRSIEAVDKENGDRVAEVTFMNGHVVEANITWDSVPEAMWDCLKQIPALRERG